MLAVQFGVLGVEGVVVLLAATGGLALAWFVCWFVATNVRVARAATRFRNTSSEALRAMMTLDEGRQFRAVLAWQQARTHIASMSQPEQLHVMRVLQSEGVQISEIVREITAFTEHMAGPPELTRDLMELANAHG